MENMDFGNIPAAAAKSLQSCPTLCDPIDRSPPGFSVPGILQARTLEWVPIFFSNAQKWSEREVTQSCPTLSDPMDCSLPVSSIHGIFQARVLEWGAIAFSIFIATNLIITVFFMKTTSFLIGTSFSFKVVDLFWYFFLFYFPPKI